MRAIFSDEQKRAICDLAAKVGVHEAARQSGIAAYNIKNWRKRWGLQPLKKGGKSPWTQEQRDAAVARANEIGVVAAARELGLHYKTLASWRNAAASEQRESEPSVMLRTPADALLAKHWPGRCLRVITSPTGRNYLHPRSVALPRGCIIAQRFRIHAGSDERLAYMDGETVAQASALHLHPEVLDALASNIATGRPEAAAHMLAAAKQMECATAVMAMRTLHSEGFFRCANIHADRLALAALVARDLLGKTKSQDDESDV